MKNVKQIATEVGAKLAYTDRDDIFIIDSTQLEAFAKALHLIVSVDDDTSTFYNGKYVYTEFGELHKIIGYTKSAGSYLVKSYYDDGDIIEDTMDASVEFQEISETDANVLFTHWDDYNRKINFSIENTSNRNYETYMTIQKEIAELTNKRNKKTDKILAKALKNVKGGEV